MKTLTGSYIEDQRRAKQLTLGQLARALGYTNIAKGARRVRALELEGRTVAGLLDRVVRVVGLDAEHVRTLMDEDRRRFEDDWNRWVSEPVAPQLRFRVIPAIWCRERLPSGLSKQEAIEYADSRVVERNLAYVLVWNRGEEVWFYPTGDTYERRMNVGEVAGPHTWLRSRRNHGFIFG